MVQKKLTRRTSTEGHRKEGRMTFGILESMGGANPCRPNEQGRGKRKSAVALTNEIGEGIAFRRDDWLIAVAKAEAVCRGWKPNGDLRSYTERGRIIPKEESLKIARALEAVEDNSVIGAFACENYDEPDSVIGFFKKGLLRIEKGRWFIG